MMSNIFTNLLKKIRPINRQISPIQNRTGMPQPIVQPKNIIKKPAGSKTGELSENSLIYAIPSKLKANVVFDKNLLFVTKDYLFDSQFLSFQSMLKKTGKLKETKTVSFEELLKIQKEFVDITNQRKRFRETTKGDAIKLFNDALKLKASDIHIRVGKGIANILIRVNGGLQEFGQMHQKQAESLCATIYQSMSDPGASDAIYQPNEYQDARISGSEMLPAGLHGIRVHSGPHVDGVLMVLRLLYADNDFFERRKAQGKRTDIYARLAFLGYSKEQIKLIYFMFSRPTGINIIAGPTGSGKSTTLMHIMEAIAEERPDKHLLSVEDPPEYPIKGCVQRPVTNATTEKERKEAFAKTMRAAMRSDPDVMMVGEVRDHSTARTAIEAAMTGHQVLTTLHANSAFNIINRMIDLLASQEVRDPINVLSDTTILTGLMFQRLVKQLCPACKIDLIDYNETLYKQMSLEFCEDCRKVLEDKKPEDSLLNPIYLNLGDHLCPDCKSKLNKMDIYPLSVIERLYRIFDMTDGSSNIAIKGPGCKKCSYTGIAGRTVVAEVVCPDPDMLKTLKGNGVDAARRYWIEKQGGKPIIDHVIEKVRIGEVDPRMAEDIVGPITTSIALQDNMLEGSEIDDLIQFEGDRLVPIKKIHTA